MSKTRELGFAGVFAIAAGAMISAGLFHLPSQVFKAIGPGVVLCYLGAALLLIPTVMSKAELVTAMPKAGGSFFFIDRGLGPAVGIVGGAAAWASLALKSAFAAMGVGMLVDLGLGGHLDPWGVKAVSCGACIVLGLLTAYGPRKAARMQIALVAALLLVLVAYVAWGVPRVGAPAYEGMVDEKAADLLRGMAMVFIAFGGVTKAAALGEEVRNPRRDVLVGMFLAAGVVGVLYVLVVGVTIGALPAQGTEGWSEMPLADAGRVFWGTGGAVLMGCAALVAFLTTGGAAVGSACKVVVTMVDEGLLPNTLGRSSDDGGPAWGGVILTVLFMVATIVTLPPGLFVAVASAMTILVFTGTMLALVLMRESRIPTYNPSWRCPGYPWVQIVGILAYGFLLVELGTGPLAVAGIVLGGAVAWYVVNVRAHVMRESALVRVAARFAAADFDEYDLEAELSRVVRERDRIQTDRFDRIIGECPMMDLPEDATRSDLFEAVAAELAPRTGLAAPEIVRLLDRREGISSTVIRPGLAIPHLIRDGIRALETVVVRSRAGVEFVEDRPKVHAVFVLAASPEERNFYLKSLMAVAEIAQEPDFDRKWLAAGSVAALREVVLAAERRREREHGYDQTSEEGVVV